MKKRSDPLWKIVGEVIPLQGPGSCARATCPNCGVRIQLSAGVVPGQGFECGLCGARCEVTDDGEADTPKVRVVHGAE